MIRTTIRLTERQAAHLRELAAAEGVSVAALVRRGVDLVLAEVSSAPRRNRLEALRVSGQFDSHTPVVPRGLDDELSDAYLDPAGGHIGGTA